MNFHYIEKKNSKIVYTHFHCYLVQIYYDCMLFYIWWLSQISASFVSFFINFICILNFSLSRLLSLSLFLSAWYRNMPDFQTQTICYRCYHFDLSTIQCDIFIYSEHSNFPNIEQNFIWQIFTDTCLFNCFKITTAENAYPINRNGIMLGQKSNTVQNEYELCHHYHCVSLISFLFFSPQVKQIIYSCT